MPQIIFQISLFLILLISSSLNDDIEININSEVTLIYEITCANM